ncbi:MAG: protein kinase [Gemmatimonadaceae bacterium]
MTDSISQLRAALAGQYQIEHAIGAGGMATVYVATDLRHHRKVALKVLRPETAALLGAERFLREITTTAQLQHPNILPLFDSGSHGPFLYYVMPFIDGETLRTKLQRETQLGIDDAVRIAVEVASALDYAHRRGVIHRDIKPENILLHEGRALVADFGIALAVSAAAGGRMTETGLAMGTPNYMSPEQAAAEHDITARSDIYSLGVVLFEMLTGSIPHQAPSVQQVIMKIATEEAPRVSSLRKSVPPNVAEAVAVALEKIPADRFSRASALAEALVTPSFRGRTSDAVPIPPRRRLSPALVAAGVAAGVAIGVLLSRAFAREAPRPVVRFAIELPDTATFLPAAGVNLAISPDGLHLVYVGRSPNGKDMLWQRELDEMGVHPIVGTDAGLIPTFSPNGAALAFTAGNTLKVVSLQGAFGGPALTIVPHGVPSAGGGIAWTDDDRIYFVDDSGAIQRVSPDGGTLTRVAPHETDAGFMWIGALPGGKNLLATSGRLGVPEASEIAVVPTNGGPVHRLFKGTMARYASGYLVYATSDGALMAVPFDAKRAVVTGRPVALFQGVDVYMGSASQFALSRTGSLVWVGYGGARDILKIDRHGTSVAADSGVRADIRDFAMSPDGARLAVTTVELTGLRVSVMAMGGGTLTPLAIEGTRNRALSWSADGRSITVLSNLADSNQLRLVPADGAGDGTELPIKGNVLSADWSPDGTALVATRAIAGVNTQVVGYRPALDSAPRALVSGPFLAQYASISPDGHWLAYSSNETGQGQVYVHPFPATRDGRWQVSPRGGMEPVWAPRGLELFYRAASGDLVSIAMTADASGRPHFSPPRPLFRILLDDNTDGRHYQAMPDNEHFLLLHSIGGSKRDLMMVENFVEEIRAKSSR